MSAFRTISVSDPRFECDRLRMVTVKSRALGTRADLTLWLPEGLSEPAPLVILLHGVYSSHWCWAMKGGAHRTAGALMAAGDLPPVMLAMPSDGLRGDGSGYLTHRTADYERWIAEEVPLAVAEATGLSPGALFLCGLSMGGFGALRIGAHLGRRCAGISAHSAITAFEQMRDFVEEDLADFDLADQHLTALDAMLAHRADLPPLRFDCGRGDRLLDANRALHAELERHGIPHSYEEFDGGHQWAYWETHLADSLRFFARFM
jgi:enterochelin esterase-like enzyme